MAGKECMKLVDRLSKQSGEGVLVYHIFFQLFDDAGYWNQVLRGSSGMSSAAARRKTPCEELSREKLVDRLVLCAKSRKFEVEDAGSVSKRTVSALAALIDGGEHDFATEAVRRCAAREGWLRQLTTENGRDISGELFPGFSGRIARDLETIAELGRDDEDALVARYLFAVTALGTRDDVLSLLTGGGTPPLTEYDLATGSKAKQGKAGVARLDMVALASQESYPYVVETDEARRRLRASMEDLLRPAGFPSRELRAGQRVTVGRDLDKEGESTLSIDPAKLAENCRWGNGEFVTGNKREAGHAVVTWGDGCVYVEDLGSTYGTMVYRRDGLPKYDERLRPHRQMKAEDGEFIGLGLDPETNMPLPKGALFRVRVETNL